MIPIPIFLSGRGSLDSQALLIVSPLLVCIYLALLILCLGLTKDAWKDRNRLGWDFLWIGFFMILGIISLPIMMFIFR